MQRWVNAVLSECSVEWMQRWVNAELSKFRVEWMQRWANAELSECRVEWMQSWVLTQLCIHSTLHLLNATFTQLCTHSTLHSLNSAYAQLCIHSTLQVANTQDEFIWSCHRPTVTHDCQPAKFENIANWIITTTQTPSCRDSYEMIVHKPHTRCPINFPSTTTRIERVHELVVLGACDPDMSSHLASMLAVYRLYICCGRMTLSSQDEMN